MDSHRRSRRNRPRRRPGPMGRLGAGRVKVRFGNFTIVIARQHLAMYRRTYGIVRVLQ